ncbi:MAG: isoprenoid biosynthesis glyoxalase ElbB [Planctomycetes bacterium]|nr:isoprenoid biosynthesis glyoxalase ElbB [Planctomycetota bacterium]
MTNTKRKVAVVLSGCGFLDGAEISEAVLTLYWLDRCDLEPVCVAPRMMQAHVVDHAAKRPVEGAARDVFVEAARIARGRLRDLAEVSADEFDAAVLPGGFGAAKNLSDFATRGAAATAHPDVARLLRGLHAQRKPIGAVCIAPAVVAAVLGHECHPELTIGDDADTAAAIEAMGARHRAAPVDRCVVDRDNRIVSAPAYMYDARIRDVGAGIEQLVNALTELLAEGGR